MTGIKAQIPDKLAFLFERGKWRYKVLYGGRGGAKSWSIATALLIMAAQAPLRILCARELQKSIQESVHRLIADRIADLGLPGFEVQEKRIVHQNGSEFVFAGLRHNANGLKSFEGVDICWVEEAHAVSAASWGILKPTIRREGSEIWISFNPELDTDPVYQEFVLTPRPDAKVVKINWSENPWLTGALMNEKDQLQRTNPEEYEYIWEGRPRPSVEGAVYADCLAAAEANGRITTVPMDSTLPVCTAWDLGYGDATAIWFFQRGPLETRVLSYIEDSGKEFAWYLRQIQSMGWLIDRHYLPWDGGSRSLQTGQSIADLIKNAGQRAEVVPQHEKYIGIDQVRTVFPSLWFDSVGCKEGLHSLRHYAWATKTTGERLREPRHDWASHGADALRTMAMGMKVAKRPSSAVATAATSHYTPRRDWAWT